jgi:hypothetical protein
MCAPEPSSNQEISVCSAVPWPFFATAWKRITSPVRAFAVRGSMERLLVVSRTTETSASALTLSPLARIFACPGRTARTSPAESTVATAGVSDVQDNAMSVRGSPFGLRGTAVRRWVDPETSGCEALVSSIVLMCGRATVIFARPTFPPTLAPTNTSPGWKSITVPSSLAPALSKGAANHSFTGFGSVFPSESLATAVNLILSPTEPEASAGVTSTLATFDSSFLSAFS